MTPIHLKPTQFAWFSLSFPKRKKAPTATSVPSTMQVPCQNPSCPATRAAVQGTAPLTQQRPTARG